MQKTPCLMLNKNTRLRVNHPSFLRLFFFWSFVFSFFANMVYRVEVLNASELQEALRKIENVIQILQVVPNFWPSL